VTTTRRQAQAVQLAVAGCN